MAEDQDTVYIALEFRGSKFPQIALRENLLNEFCKFTVVVIELLPMHAVFDLAGCGSV